MKSKLYTLPNMQILPPPIVILYIWTVTCVTLHPSTVGRSITCNSFRFFTSTENSYWQISRCKGEQWTRHANPIILQGFVGALVTKFVANICSVCAKHLPESSVTAISSVDSAVREHRKSNSRIKECWIRFANILCISFFSFPCRALSDELWVRCRSDGKW